MHPKRVANPDAKCPKVKDKTLNGMVMAAWDAGWWCEGTADGHAQCYAIPPDGSRGFIVTVAGTPSDHRTIPNTRSSLRRAGLKL